jgi:hypothetical protein
MLLVPRLLGRNYKSNNKVIRRGDGRLALETEGEVEMLLVVIGIIATTVFFLLVVFLALAGGISIIDKLFPSLLMSESERRLLNPPSKEELFKETATSKWGRDGGWDKLAEWAERNKRANSTNPSGES